MSRGSLSKNKFNSTLNQPRVGGAASKAVESYDDHKLAQRLLLEEHLMALEAQQHMADAALRDPQDMLQRNRITGTTNCDEDVIPNMLKGQKYDL